MKAELQHHAHTVALAIALSTHTARQRGAFARHGGFLVACSLLFAVPALTREDDVVAPADSTPADARAVPSTPAPVSAENEKDFTRGYTAGGGAVLGLAVGITATVLAGVASPEAGFLTAVIGIPTATAGFSALGALVGGATPYEIAASGTGSVLGMLMGIPAFFVGALLGNVVLLGAAVTGINPFAGLNPSYLGILYIGLGTAGLGSIVGSIAGAVGGAVGIPRESE